MCGVGLAFVGLDCTFLNLTFYFDGAFTQPTTFLTNWKMFVTTSLHSIKSLLTFWNSFELKSKDVISEYSINASCSSITIPHNQQLGVKLFSFIFYSFYTRLVLLFVSFLFLLTNMFTAFFFKTLGFLFKCLHFVTQIGLKLCGYWLNYS